MARHQHDDDLALASEFDGPMPEYAPPPAPMSSISEPEAQPALVMDTAISNAIVTNAPLSMEQMRCAMDHYEYLEAMLRRSGPRFVNARRDAADMFNKTLVLFRAAEERAAAPPLKQDRAPLLA